MPPKVKYTREYILSAALDMTRENGIESVTARELGARLGASSRPIFTAFDNMEEVHIEIYRAAKKIFYQYIEDYMSYSPAIKRYWIQMVRFSIEEPKLFQLLFMKEMARKPDIISAIHELYHNPAEVTGSLIKDYNLNEDTAWKILCHITIFSYGLTVLCARRICTYSEKEIDMLIKDELDGIVWLMKSGDCKNIL